MVEFSIKEDVPLPARAARGQKSPYPFADMKIGSHFVVPVKPDAEIKDEKKRALKLADDFKTVSSRMSGAVRRYKQRTPGVEFAVRTVEGQGIGVWRVASE